LEVSYYSLYFVKLLLSFITVAMKRGKKIISVLIFLFISTSISSQVTIGSHLEPLPGSLLDLKETNASNENTTRGIMLPRVRLSDLNNLYPMFENHANPGFPDSNYDDKTEKSDQDLKHIGLTVYNVNESARDNLKKGVYYWDGARWVYAKDDKGVWETLGNAGTDSTVNYLGTSDARPFILKSNNKEGLRIATDGKIGIGGEKAPQATLHVNGNVVITETPVYHSSQSQVLVVNNDGKVGVAGAVPAKLMHIQSLEEQEYKQNSGDSPLQGITFNKGGVANALSVLWKSDEMGMNNIVDEQAHAGGASFEYFVFKDKGLYEVSGFILYEPSCQYNYKSSTLDDVKNEINGALAGLNVAIQRQEAGKSGWDNIAATRALWSGRAIYGTSSTAYVPPTTVSFQKGDKIRMVFYRPSDTFGRPHGKGAIWGITNVIGIDVKKGLRIMMIDG
jgi:hypothetical protein